MAQILILEENRREFDQLRRCIESNGHTVWRSTKINDALDFLRRYKIDLIISAIALDEVDVFDFLRAVKNNGDTASIPFVFYCADNAQHERYATDTIKAAGNVLGTRKFIFLPEFNGKKLWEELSECMPQTALKRDSLGSAVTTYPISDLPRSHNKRLGHGA
jgi:CheY-like chemotaxis protein